MPLLKIAVTAFLITQTIITSIGSILIKKSKKETLYYWLTAQIIYLSAALLMFIISLNSPIYPYRLILYFIINTAALFIILAAQKNSRFLSRTMSYLLFFSILAAQLVCQLYKCKPIVSFLLIAIFNAIAFLLFAISLKRWKIETSSNFKRLSGIATAILAAAIFLAPLGSKLFPAITYITLLFFQIIASLFFLFFVYETDTAQRYKKMFRSLFEASMPLYQSIFHKIGLPLIILNPDGIIISANQKTGLLLEEKTSKLKLKNFVTYINDENKQEMGKKLLTIKPGGLISAKKDFKCWIVKKNKKPLLVKISFILSVFAEDQNSHYIIISLEDISHNMLENKRIREYAQSLEERLTLRNIELSSKNKELALKNHELIHINKSKNIFFANVSHELRTPLVAVCGYIEMLLENKLGPTTEKMRDAFNIAIKNLNRQTSFINNLLDLARIEAYQEKIDRQQINLKKSADQIIFQMSNQAEEKGLRLHNQISNHIPDVMIDPRHIEQILLNLVSNAIKFTQQGKITITAFRKKAGRVIVEVSDTGPGIPDKDKAYIFDRFYQIERRSSTKERGTGLGLAIVKEIVNTYDGKITMRDRPDGGSIFSFDLPSSETSKEKKKHIRKILIISANRQQNKRIKEFLKKSRIQVFNAVTGLQGLEMINQQNFDLIFIDMILPDLEAAEICKMVKESKQQPKTPIYITTFSLGEEERETLFLVGAKGIVTKPFDERAIERVMTDELQS